MDIEGKYTLPNGEVLEVHVNVAVNTWKDGEWKGFTECSLDEFFNALHILREDGPVTFEPKERKVDE